MRWTPPSLEFFQMMLTFASWMHQELFEGKSRLGLHVTARGRVTAFTGISYVFVHAFIRGECTTAADYVREIE